MACKWRYSASVALLLSLLATTVAKADDFVRIEVSRSAGPGGVSRVFVVAPNDQQTQRKLQQGNTWAIAINTNGYTHATGAIAIGDRVFLVDEAAQKRLCAAHSNAVVLVDSTKKGR